ncbi:hypothetical protein LC653_28040 [Nostoc sp. CHAB 5784]|uniref:hypothetical protein n=1 Tax=Nostoc mirabile TaxID=2907820 RepID=UPI001E2B6911|nr:hypothetical protein [Nostoc mirabile]MCC5667630.1 hypothetical protein [Nostoc mirabile CHAB5784]
MLSEWRSEKLLAASRTKGLCNIIDVGSLAFSLARQRKGLPNKKIPNKFTKKLSLLIPLCSLCLCGSFIWVIYFLEVPKADFTIIQAVQFHEKFPDLLDAQYLLFATHPLREIENHASASTDSYLTFYAFSSNFSQPINLPGASAKEVYHLISLLEENALKASSTSVKTSVLEAAKNASQ